MNRLRKAYRITAVKVVEFHNFGTASIEIPEGGRLSLLGNNGSGIQRFSMQPPSTASANGSPGRMPSK